MAVLAHSAETNDRLFDGVTSPFTLHNPPTTDFSLPS